MKYLSRLSFVSPDWSGSFKDVEVPVNYLSALKYSLQFNFELHCEVLANYFCLKNMKVMSYNTYYLFLQFNDTNSISRWKIIFKFDFKIQFYLFTGVFRGMSLAWGCADSGGLKFKISSIMYIYLFIGPR